MVVAISGTGSVVKPLQSRIMRRGGHDRDNSPVGASRLTDIGAKTFCSRRYGYTPPPGGGVEGELEEAPESKVAKVRSVTPGSLCHAKEPHRAERRITWSGHAKRQ